MTHKESVLISAYTGFLLTKNFADVQAFCEELLGRPILTHEFACDKTLAKIHKKCKPMIIDLINKIEEE